MALKLPEKYLKENLVDQYSAAYIFYMFSGQDDELTAMSELGKATREESDEDREAREAIEALDTADGFFRWMRKQISQANKELLIGKMKEHEAEALPMVKKRVLTNRIDHFIENAARFFIACEENVSGWLVENFGQIQDPYAKSMMCLVLGIRGDESCAPLLLEQAERLKGAVANEKLEQGPIIALYKIAGMEENLK
jgi:hypothetical protein